MTPNPRDSFTQFFARYPDSVSELAGAVRKVIRSAIPDATETVDESGRVLGYAVGSGYSGLVCTIIPSKTGLKLGIVRGADLSDPHALLEGPDKRHRYIKINRPEDLRRPGIEELLKAAKKAATRS